MIGNAHGYQQENVGLSIEKPLEIQQSSSGRSPLKEVRVDKVLNTPPQPKQVMGNMTLAEFSETDCPPSALSDKVLNHALSLHDRKEVIELKTGGKVRVFMLHYKR